MFFGLCCKKKKKRLKRDATLILEEQHNKRLGRPILWDKQPNGGQAETIRATTLHQHSLNPVSSKAPSAEVCFSGSVGVLDSATLSSIPLQTLRTCTEWCPFRDYNPSFNNQIENNNRLWTIMTPLLDLIWIFFGNKSDYKNAEQMKSHETHHTGANIRK